jgi:glycosyltransferase involved in cell wall biosynthesis
MHKGGAIGGAPMSMLQISERLDPATYTPKVIFSQPGPMIDLARRAGVATGVLPMTGAFMYGAQVPLGPRTLLPALAAFRGTVAGARTLLRSERPDLVHLNTSALLPLGFAAEREGIPVVWHVREVVNPGTTVGRWLAGRIFSTADHVIAASGYAAAGLPEGNPEGKKVSVIHNAVDTVHFDPDRVNGAETRSRLGIDASAVVVGILGSVQDVKGHFVLAAAAKRLLAKRPDMVFMVVGGGAPEGYRKTWKGRLKTALGVAMDNEHRLRRMIDRDGTGQNFRFCGYQADVAPFVAAMDVVVSPNLAPEGFGRPLIEGMAMARPVVASDIGPSREILGDDTAMFSPPGDIDKLARAIDWLASDRDTAKRMGKTGRKRALESFGIDDHVRAVSRVYERVLGVGEPSRVPIV